MRGLSDLQSRAALGLGAAVGAGGLLTQRLLLVGLGTLVVGYWLVPRLVGPPEASVELQRELVGQPTATGDTVTVTTTVRNTGGRALYGLSLAEGVPESVPVTGQTRLQAARLPPGGTQSVEYVVGVRPGTHEYAPTRVTAHDWSGQYAVDATLPVETVIVWSDSDESASEGESGRLRGGDATDREQPSEGRAADDSQPVESEDEDDESGNRQAETVVCLDAQQTGRTGTDPSTGVGTLVDCAVTAGRELPRPVWLAVVDAAGTCHLRRDVSGDAAAWLTQRLATPETPTGVWPAARREGPALPGTVASALADAVPRTARLYLVRGVLDDRVVRLAHRLDTMGYDIVVVHPQQAGDGSWRDQAATLGSDAPVDIIEWSPNTTLRHAGE